MCPAGRCQSRPGPAPLRRPGAASPPPHAALDPTWRSRIPVSNTWETLSPATHGACAALPALCTHTDGRTHGRGHTPRAHAPLPRPEPRWGPAPPRAPRPSSSSAPYSRLGGGRRCGRGEREAEAPEKSCPEESGPGGALRGRGAGGERGALGHGPRGRAEERLRPLAVRAPGTMWRRRPAPGAGPGPARGAEGSAASQRAGASIIPAAAGSRARQSSAPSWPAPRPLGQSAPGGREGAAGTALPGIPEGREHALRGVEEGKGRGGGRGDGVRMRNARRASRKWGRALAGRAELCFPADSAAKEGSVGSAGRPAVTLRCSLGLRRGCTAAKSGLSPSSSGRRRWKGPARKRSSGSRVPALPDRVGWRSRPFGVALRGAGAALPRSRPVKCSGAGPCAFPFAKYITRGAFLTARAAGRRHCRCEALSSLFLFQWSRPVATTTASLPGGGLRAGAEGTGGGCVSALGEVQLPSVAEACWASVGLLKSRWAWMQRGWRTVTCCRSAVCSIFLHLPFGVGQKNDRKSIAGLCISPAVGQGVHLRVYLVQATQMNSSF
ncbi:uncharacterized protein LOC110401058 [Numida meleagris]|uniref:uncharacterized protein LOC110401058 n=1 Tax=Numida meleagris TaxID=8996 RepID=UPI000B3DD59C|nr:uncharacterized protein LOC110401058 [Numida meleagris]